ncbi:MAG: hypothetical protein BMS9Abin11_1739 [Gammaproteobacteria bacterium]|nr:MAG: hypothetical protein BMS9Abin11_1739 [Gammaproteobacteria bacterium]
MLRKLSLILAAVVLSGTCVVAQAVDWKQFNPSGGNFTIQFPGTPKDANAKKYVSKRVFNQHLYMYSDAGKAAYMLQYFDIEENHRKSKSNREWLDGLQERVSVKANRTLLSNETIRVSGYLARRMVLKDASKNVFFHAQLVLANNRMYTMLVVTNSKDSSAAQVRKFIRSFRILSKKSGTPGPSDFQDLK